MLGKNSKGFSLIEVLLVTAILAVLGSSGVGYYRNFAKNVEVTVSARTIISDLRGARGKTMAGEQEQKWGIHFVNGAQDYYELFRTPTNYADPGVTIEETKYLQSGISFTDPADSATKDVLFNGVFGTTTAATVSVASQSDSYTINIGVLGTIY